MNKLLISVVVPVYNVEDYLPKCIDSIIKQTYNNLEIILVDDGAKDDSGKICDKYAEMDKRIKVIHKKNGGLSDARNAGIDIMQGEYVTFVDSDDYLDKYFVQHLYESMKLSNADISIANFKRVGDNYTVLENQEQKFKVETFSKDEALANLYNKKYSYQFTTATCKLYKSSLFKDIRFPVGRNYEDTATTHKVIGAASKVSYIDIELYFYYTRETSITKSETFVKDDAFLATAERVAYFESYGDKYLLSKAVLQHIATLMGVYIRVSDSERLRKSEIYNHIKTQSNKYWRIIVKSPNLAIRVLLFYLSPTFYKKIVLR